MPLVQGSSGAGDPDLAEIEDKCGKDGISEDLRRVLETFDRLAWLIHVDAPLFRFCVEESTADERSPIDPDFTGWPGELPNEGGCFRLG